eukprot:ctg_5153.g526
MSGGGARAHASSGRGHHVTGRGRASRGAMVAAAWRATVHRPARVLVPAFGRYRRVSGIAECGHCGDGGRAATCERLLRALQRPPGVCLPPGVPAADARGGQREEMASIDTADAEAMRTLLYASIPSLDDAQALVWRTARLFLERLQCRPVHVALSLRTDVASLQTLLCSSSSSSSSNNN